MTAKLQLFTSPSAFPNPQRLRLFIHDKGIADPFAATLSSLVNRHLSDTREWLPGGDAPTFSDITLATAIAFSKFPVNATPLDERFEVLDAYAEP